MVSSAYRFSPFGTTPKPKYVMNTDDSNVFMWQNKLVSIQHPKIKETGIIKRLPNHSAEIIPKIDQNAISNTNYTTSTQRRPPHYF